jgi:hypothetical protein
MPEQAQEIEMFEFNINDIVAVQLTDTGKKVVNAYYDNQFGRMKASYIPEFWEEAKKLLGPANEKSKEIPPDGWKQFQLWELMQIFTPSFPWFRDAEQCFVDNKIRYIGSGI